MRTVPRAILVCCLVAVGVFSFSEPARSSESSPMPEAPACLELEAELGQLARSTNAAPKLGLYRDLAERADAAECPYAAARASAGLAVYDGLNLADFPSALVHVRKSRERLAAWAAFAGTHEQPTAADILDLEISLETHTLVALFGLGWLDEARLKLEEVRALHRRATRMTPKKRFDLGVQGSRVLRRLGALDEASAALESVRGLLEKVPEAAAASWHQERGWVARARRDLAAAAASFDRALAFDLDDGYRAGILVDRADLALRSGRPADALRDIESAYALASAADGLHLNAHLRRVYAQVLDAIGDPERARERLDRSLDLLDATRDRWTDLGFAYLADRESYLGHRLDLAARSGDPLDLWQVFEKRQARVLRRRLAPEAMRPALQDEFRASRRALLESLWRFEQAGLDATRRRLLEARFLEARFLEARTRLRSAQALLASETERENAPRTLEPRQAAELLGEKTLGLLLLPGRERLQILTLEPSGELGRVEVAVSAAEIAARVRGYADAVRSRSASSLAAASSRLAELLFAGLADRLEGVERLVVAANGPLEGFPLDALPRPGDERPLVASHEVVHVPSFSVLAAMRRDRACAPARRSILAVGDAVFGTSDLRWPAGLGEVRGAEEAWATDRLASSGEEILAIRRHFEGEVTLLAGAAATRPRVLEEAPHHRLLHLATHAITDVRRPERSRLTLSCADEAGRAVDGGCDLFLPEIAELELCDSAVVLSACSSAAGPRVLGEGALSLSRAFAEAGADAVVATAWAVEDQAASRLMHLFYLYLKNGRTVSAALREARARVAATGAPPLEWAPFFFSGDWRIALERE